MAPSLTPSPTPSLLAVFAHPDDESLACGGLLARCAQLGVRVTLLCASHGDYAGLGDLRREELRAAAHTLGVSKVVLLDHPDGELAWADRLQEDIRDAILRFRPDVVVTFAEDGLYWHPDHIAVFEKTTAAVASLDSALEDAAPALYYVTMPPGLMRAVAGHAVGAASAGGPATVLGIDVDAFGALAQPPTIVLDVAEFAGAKLAALRCHRTQVVDSPFDVIDAADAARLLGTEHFRRAEVGSQAAVFIDTLACAIR